MLIVSLTLPYSRSPEDLPVSGEQSTLALVGCAKPKTLFRPSCSENIAAAHPSREARHCGERGTEGTVALRGGGTEGRRHGEEGGRSTEEL